MKKVTITGGGLAGLSLAAALRLRQVPVTVVEAGNYPRHRVCGEFISGVGATTLGFLGIEDLLEDARPQSTMCWFENGTVIHRDTLPVPARGISRYQLDERLKRRVEELGGEIITGVRAQPEAAEGLVWAAGKRPGGGQWLGLKAHVRGWKSAADLEMHSGTNGYVGVAGVEDGWFNVCGLFRRDRAMVAKGPDLLPAYIEAGGNARFAKDLRRAEWRDGSFSAAAGFKLGRQPALPGLFRLGDAHSMIPPFAGNGMSMAFQSAECVCAPLVEWSAGKTPWQEAVAASQRALARRFGRRLAAAALMHRLILWKPCRSMLRGLSGFHLLPFRPMLSLVR